MTDGALLAARKVLDTPELLCLIFDSIPLVAPILNQGRSRAAARCMLVNRYWPCVAVRCAWRFCGSVQQFSLFQPDDIQLQPWIRDLVKLERMPERLQWYANRIQALSFDIEPPAHRSLRDWLSWEMERISEDDESRFHDILRNYSFPKVQQLKPCGMKAVIELHTPDVIRQYLQP